MHEGEVEALERKVCGRVLGRLVVCRHVVCRDATAKVCLLVRHDYAMMKRNLLK